MKVESYVLEIRARKAGISSFRRHDTYGEALVYARGRILEQLSDEVEILASHRDDRNESSLLYVVTLYHEFRIYRETHESNL